MKKFRYQSFINSVRYVASLGMMVLLASCYEPWGEECIMADEWGNIERVAVTIDAKNEWTPAYVSVRAGEYLLMSTAGFVDLCPGGVAFSPADEGDNVDDVVQLSKSNTLRTQLKKNGQVLIDPRERRWQDSGIVVREGQKLGIAIDGWYRTWENADIGDPLHLSGKGLYAYIGPEPPGDPGDGDYPYYFPSDQIEDGVNIVFVDDGAYEEDIISDLEAPWQDDLDYYWADKSAFEAPQFFALYDNGTVGKGGGFSGLVPDLPEGYMVRGSVARDEGPTIIFGDDASNQGHYVDPVSCMPLDDICKQENWPGGQIPVGCKDAKAGKLWFRYARSADVIDVETQEEYIIGAKSPWRGRYAWDLHPCNACMDITILNTCTAIALSRSNLPTFFACTAAWAAACGKTEHLSSGLFVTMDPDATEEEKQDGQYHCKELVCPETGVFEEDACAPDTGQEGRDVRAFNVQDVGMGIKHPYQDHWVNEVPPPRGYRDNKGGYNINVSASCPGLYGQYLEMYIATNSQVHSNDTDVVSVDPAAFAMSMDPHYNTCIDKYGNYSTDSEGCSSVVPYDKNGEVYFRLTDRVGTCDDPNAVPEYEDNVGTYTVHLQTTRVDSGFSNFISALTDPIKEIVYGTCRSGFDKSNNPCPDGGCLQHQCAPEEWQRGLGQKLYQQIIGDTGIGLSYFASLARAALVLFVCVYGLMFMLGLIRDSQYDFAVNVIRFIIIQQVISPESWYFFNVTFFSFFTDGMNDLISIMAGGFSDAFVDLVVDPRSNDMAVPISDIGAAPFVTDTSVPMIADGYQIDTNINRDPFAFANYTMTFFFSHETFAKISALLFVSPIGFLYVLLVLLGVFFYVVAVMKAVVLYLVAMLALALLIGVAPIFLIFWLFGYTRPYFKNWLQQLLSYMFQPVMVLAALAIFSVIVHSAMYVLLHYDVCWQCVWNAEIDVGFTTIEFCAFKFYMPWEGSSSIDSITGGFFYLLFFIIVTNAMLKFVDFMATLAAQITSGDSGNLLNKGANSFISGSVAMTKTVVGFATKIASPILSMFKK